MENVLNHILRKHFSVWRFQICGGKILTLFLHRVMPLYDNLLNKPVDVLNRMGLIVNSQGFIANFPKSGEFRALL